MILLLESFANTKPDLLNKTQQLMNDMPNQFTKSEVKQQWFRKLLKIVQVDDFYNQLHGWCHEMSKENSVFKLWSFVTFSVLEPLIFLYLSIRSGNFTARNATVSRLAPMFFNTNHRNYARLCAQHLYDLKNASSYVLERLANAFAVNRTK